MVLPADYTRLKRIFFLDPNMPAIKKKWFSPLTPFPPQQRVVATRRHSEFLEEESRRLNILGVPSDGTKSHRIRFEFLGFRESKIAAIPIRLFSVQDRIPIGGSRRGHLAAIAGRAAVARAVHLPNKSRCFGPEKCRSVGPNLSNPSAMLARTRENVNLSGLDAMAHKKYASVGGQIYCQIAFYGGGRFSQPPHARHNRQ